MIRILVVEDESQISSIVVKYLQKNGFECHVAENGLEALQMFSEQHFHLVILDIMMPGIDGYEVLQRIREVSQVPVIMLTAKQDEVDRLKGFQIGADDYVIKPFSPRELVERVKVFLKRIYNVGDEVVISSGSLQLYTSSMKLVRNGEAIDLTSTEFKILHALMKNMNQILTREQLIEMVFGVGYDGFDRNIDSYIKRIRQKIEIDPKKPEYLKTKYGQGYVFDGDDHR
ncbi:response regulator transcription factor [Acidaminobacter hydrogenoformans]|uniref:Stage 0 sporulation protein A homolog n=1 Tax=Acidaminobacter hydrogenoformans DSM 2784 TaxID=1120920 RepID=A0A1G5S570_9FIRM|nr:response regulator transcription factor [Acidaminobacter hydrogenoformans]SCZ80901.1 DNA-binding response regulator, OmpR family, contains REC and winged-helix (wHTH) domain [Acidaminobacter hydrogenoformans DSM 2784]